MTKKNFGLSRKKKQNRNEIQTIQNILQTQNRKFAPMYLEQKFGKLPHRIYMK